MTETAILRDIVVRLSHGARRLFRMHVGVYRALHSDEFIHIGTPGMSDLCGLQSVTITPDMVGRQVAVFVALEVKSATGRATANQQDFLHLVRQLGGIAGVVRSADEAEKLLCCTAGVES
jgi:hypothetical protein